VQDLGFRVEGSGLRVWGLGLSARGLLTSRYGTQTVFGQRETILGLAGPGRCFANTVEGRRFSVDESRFEESVLSQYCFWGLCFGVAGVIMPYP
jgi:hypothetical protein